MATEQQPQKETKTTTKCTCTKKLIAIEKDIALLKAEILRLRAVIKGGR